MKKGKTMRLIDADALEKDTEWSEYEDDFVSYSQLNIDCAPTVDAVPVVRCKDCKCAKPEKGYFVCDYQSAAVLPDWYCWNGERKDDERNI